jgi:hypothetical protein
VLCGDKPVSELRKLIEHTLSDAAEPIVAVKMAPPGQTIAD